jgi:hypothetical protein
MPDGRPRASRWQAISPMSIFVSTFIYMPYFSSISVSAAMLR